MSKLCINARTEMSLKGHQRQLCNCNSNRKNVNWKCYGTCPVNKRVYIVPIKSMFIGETN